MLQLLVSVLLLASSWALYPSSSNVIELTSSNFDKLVTTRDDVWIVEFFAPWCGHCQALVPEYTKAAEALKGIVKVGAVNAVEHKDLGGRYGVRGFPTIKIFGANKNKPEDYSGARTAQGLVDVALQAAKAKVSKDSLRGKRSLSSSGEDTDNEDVIELTDSNFDKKVLQSKDMWLVEFFAPWCGYCKNLAPHWAKAATALKGKVKLGAIDATVHQVQASKYGIEEYPTIKFFPPGKKCSDSVADYDGGRTSNHIVKWALEKLAENVPAPEVSQIIFDQSPFKETSREKFCV